MTTVINNPGNETAERTGLGFILGIIAVIALGAVLLMYFLPQLRTAETPENKTTIEVQLPPVPPPTTTP